MYGQLERLEPSHPITLPTPIIRADSLAHVTLERASPEKMLEFLADFGFVSAGESSGRHYMRAHADGRPFSVEIIPANQDSFVGFALAAATAADLRRLAAETGIPIENDERPGGGWRVRLRDPNGFPVDVIHGAEPVAALPTREPITIMNSTSRPVRVNQPIRTAAQPAPVMRLGHVVLQVTDLAASIQWYMRHLGFLVSDVQLVGDAIPVLAFLRFNRGTVPTDHHCLALLGGPTPSLLHVSTETLDIDAVGQGQQYLRARNWKHHWGLGRHILGSQFFDYWKDPVGDEWEHYADGDLLTAEYPSGYWKLALGSLWSWGDDLPPGLAPPGPPPADAPPQVTELFRALSVPARPWLR
jgi:hypothetical protein